MASTLAGCLLCYETPPTLVRLCGQTDGMHYTALHAPWYQSPGTCPYLLAVLLSPSHCDYHALSSPFLAPPSNCFVILLVTAISSAIQLIRSTQLPLPFRKKGSGQKKTFNRQSKSRPSRLGKALLATLDTH